MCSATNTWPDLATRRLRLRRPRLGEVSRIAELANDYDVARMTTSMPYPFTLDDALSFVSRAQASDPEREAIFALDAEGEGLVGVMGLHPRPSISGLVAPEIGCWIGRPYWGRGYATEAADAVLAWALGEWGRRYVLSGHFADNPASGAVLCKSGFLYTGEVQSRFSKARGETAPTRMMVRLA